MLSCKAGWLSSHAPMPRGRGTCVSPAPMPKGRGGGRKPYASVVLMGEGDSQDSFTPCYPPLCYLCVFAHVA